jgi:hypothetical protein
VLVYALVSLLGLFGSIATTVLIYRFGVIPALRSIRTEGRFSDLWFNAGNAYRFGLCCIPIGIAASSAGALLLVNGLMSEALGAIGGGIALAVLGNLIRFQAEKRYRSS